MVTVDIQTHTVDTCLFLIFKIICMKEKKKKAGDMENNVLHHHHSLKTIIISEWGTSVPKLVYLT